MLRLILFTFIGSILASEGQQHEALFNKEFPLDMNWVKDRLIALETKLNEQGRVIQNQQLEIEWMRNKLNEPNKRHERSVNDQQQVGSPLIRRSCAELFQANSSLPSGKYWIDPDGQGTGDEPFQVFCNMTTGATLVSHDSESPMRVRPCNATGDCYKRQINYNTATMKQLEILTKLSTECSQTIRYECQNAPLKSSDDDQSFWRDRHGNRNYDWTGSHPHHYNAICKCGLTQTCRDSQSLCNCNSESLRNKKAVDANVITDKNRLPVTRLNFGLIPTSKNAQANYTLGPLKCSGLGGLKPSSCLDLWRTGHTLNGFYAVQPSPTGGERFAPTETIFCDFKLLREIGALSTDTIDPNYIEDLKNLLGREVDKTRTYFDVYRKSGFQGNPNEIVTYHGVNVNVGGAINPKEGVFTAPQDGVYMFSFTALKIENSFDLRFFLQRNGVTVTASYGASEASVPLSMFIILQLSRGDKVAVVIHTGRSYDTDGEIFTHFSGAFLF